MKYFKNNEINLRNDWKKYGSWHLLGYYVQVKNENNTLKADKNPGKT